MTLADAYARLAAAFGRTAADFLACNGAAPRAAFLPDEAARAALLARLRHARAEAAAGPAPRPAPPSPP